MIERSSLLSLLPSPEDRHPPSLSLSVLTPVYNERHLVGPSLSRVLALQHERISRLELIVVDDASTDGSWEVIQRLAVADPRVKALRHPRNMGKGAALRTALARATGDVCLVHDADMEYHPGDIPALLRPVIEEGADVVYGSRYLVADYRRPLNFRHSLVNRALTALTNLLTDLDLSDVETCYKLVNTTLLRSIPLRSNDFRIELELTMKLARRRARIFEVPIRYLPRTPEEGKKMSPVHGLLALLVLARFTVLDDMWQEDEYGSRMLAELQHARRFNRWLADTLRPFLGDRLLELGAGVAGLTSQFIPRELYVAADTNPHYLRYLHSYSLGKPYLRVVELDPRDPAGFASLQGAFDTVLWVSGLERVEDEARALANVGQALGPGGRAVLVVPQDPFLFNSLDQALEHRRRYTRQSLRDVLERAGLRLERLFDFNRSAVPAWILNGRLGRRRFSRVQLKTFEVLMPLIRQIDELWPWPGLSLVAVAVKETA